VYEPPEPDDGIRVLVDRLWPRGLSREEAALDEWLKSVSPSAELRRWYHAQPEERAAGFRERYRAELAGPEHRDALDHLRELARSGSVTLLTAAKDVGHSHAAAIIARLAEGRPDS
jgi:uncharacterized protein YeaO (DUF488 family)